MEVSGSCRRPSIPNGWLVGGTGELVLVNLQQQSDGYTTPCFMSLPPSAKAPSVVSMASWMLSTCDPFVPHQFYIGTRSHDVALAGLGLTMYTIDQAGSYTHRDSSTSQVLRWRCFTTMPSFMPSKCNTTLDMSVKKIGMQINLPIMSIAFLVFSSRCSFTID